MAAARPLFPRKNVQPTEVNHEVHIAAFTWPIHAPPLWDASWDRFLTVSDLHEAAYETATEHLERIEHSLARSNIQTSTRIECGALPEVIARIVRDEGFDAIVLARGLPGWREVVDELTVATLLVGSVEDNGGTPKEALQAVTAA